MNPREDNDWSTDPRVAPSTCPVCGKHLDAATNPEDPSARSEPGDVSICLWCQSVLIFGEDLALQLPDPEAAAALYSNQEILRLRAAAKAAMAGEEVQFRGTVTEIDVAPEDYPITVSITDEETELVLYRQVVEDDGALTLPGGFTRPFRLEFTRRDGTTWP